MHIDYTLHFWTLVTQLTGLTGFFTFLWHAFKWIKRAVMFIKHLVDAVSVILDEHREVYLWYSSVKEGKTLPPNAIG